MIDDDFRVLGFNIHVWLLDMGVYLSTPKTDKTSEDGENEKLRYGVSSMQGWRTSMEDAVSSWLHCSYETLVLAKFSIL